MKTTNYQLPTTNCVVFNLKKLSISILFFLLTHLIQAQLPNWYFFKPGNNGTNIRFTPSPSLQSNTIPVFLDESGVNPIPNYYAVNAMYDDNGKALFYIVLANINNVATAYFYDKDGGLMLEKDFLYEKLDNYTVPAREIPIISLGCNRFHAIVGNIVTEIDMVNKTWTNIFSNYIVSNGPLDALNVYGMSGVNYLTTALEVGSVTQTSYKIYSLSGNLPGANTRTIRIVEISKTNNQILNLVDYDFSSFNLPGTSTIYSTNFTRALSELELSMDGQLLAFAEEENILIFNLTSNGFVNTSNPLNALYFYQNTPTVLEYSIGGLEFSASNNKLIFSRYDPSVTPTLPEAIAIWDFTINSTPSFITGTSNYARSQIELGLDGKLYTSSATHLAEISLIGTPTVTDVISANFEFNNDPSNCHIRTLPDQITGHNYVAAAFDIQSLDVTSSTTWQPGIGNNPFDAISSISVLQKITIKSGVVLNVKELTLNFLTNAELVVEPGATLNITHSILKSHDCGLMWKGINVLDNGITGGSFSITNNNLLEASMIRDAINGIKINGPNSNLVVHGNTEFTANETDIKITNGNKAKIQIHRATFDGGTVLRDQTKGSNYGWTIDNLFRTTTNIYLIDCSSKIEIGSIGQGGCDFKYAEYGIRAIKSNAVSFNNTFLNHMRYGIHGNAQKITRRTIDVFDNVFTEVQQPIRLENWVSSTIQSNQFYTSREFGIDYLENENCMLLVGDLLNPAKGNLFDFCNWTGINLSSNSGILTELIIANNSINNHPYATGIVVSEYGTGGVSPSFKTLRIYNNNMSQIGHGIKLYNIEGHNTDYSGVGPTPHDQKFNENTLVDNNLIVFTTQLPPNNQVGIQTNNSSKLNILNNVVNSQRGDDWRNTAILTDNAYWSAIYGNTATGGSGIRIGGNMLTSNIYCNSLDGSSTGILINYCYLRPLGGLHGILTTQSRTNSFPNISDVDMRLYYSDKDLNQWVFSGTVPNIDYTYASGILPNIEGGYGLNVCGEYIGDGIEIIETKKEGVILEKDFLKSYSEKIMTPRLNGNSLTITDYGKINMLKTAISHAKDSPMISKGSSHFPNQIALANYYIQTKKYDSASIIIKNTIARDSLEIELCWTYTTFLKLKAQTTRLNEKEVERLIEIARKNQFTQSLAAPLARTVVKQYLHLDIYEQDGYTPSIKGAIMANCNFSSLNNLEVNLLFQENQKTGVVAKTMPNGTFEIDGETLKSLNQDSSYRISCMLPDSSIIYSPIGSIHQFIAMRQIQFNCNAALLKGGVINETSNSLKNLIIYPNPSNGIITIKGLNDDPKIRILNTLGEIVYFGSINKTGQIDISDLAKGVYILKVIGAEDKAHKIIID